MEHTTITTNEEQTLRPHAQDAKPDARAEDGARGGTLEWRKGKARLRLSLGTFGRRMVTLSTCRTRAQAEERRVLLVTLAEKLAESGQVAIGFPLLQNAAKRDGRALDAVVQAIERVAKGDARAKPTGETTFRQIGEQWTSGELHRAYPDHVRAKRSGKEDAERFKLYVYPYVGEVPIARLTLDHAMEVMRRIPADRAPATRRHVGQAMRKLVSYAVFPLRLLPDNPLDQPNFLPQLGPRKLKSYLYPTEDRTLIGCATVPFEYRVLYAFLTREGMRASEAARLTWSDLDLDHGLVTLAKNKTDDPRAWPLRPDVKRALCALRTLRGVDGHDAARVFTARPQPKHLRKHLVAAGILRPTLFRKDDGYQSIRVHDLRATFATVALANGETEEWVRRRTGHKSTAMVQRYNRSAQNAADVSLGDLAPMDTAIPELARVSGDGPDSGDGAAGSGDGPDSSDGPDSGTGEIAGWHTAGTAPREASRDVASDAENPGKTAVSRPAERTDADFESSNRGSNPRAGTRRFRFFDHERRLFRRLFAGGQRRSIAREHNGIIVA